MSFYTKDEHDTKHEKSFSYICIKAEPQVPVLIHTFKEEPKEFDDIEPEYHPCSPIKVDIKEELRPDHFPENQVFDNQKDISLCSEDKEICEDDFTAVNQDCKSSNKIFNNFEFQQHTNVLYAGEFTETGNENDLISQRNDFSSNCLKNSCVEDRIENFVNKDSKDISISKKILSIEEHVYSCDVCGKVFTQKRSALRHLTIHSRGEESYMCDICTRSFTWKGNLRKHMHLHTGNLHHTCEICNKLFISKNELENHTRVHTGARPFSCEICNKSFSQKSTLNAHKILHTGNSPHTCEICNRSFSGKCNLQEHRRIHTGVRPYTCGICKKSFAFKTSFKRHRRLHTGDKPFICKICSKSFSLQDYLAKHIKTHKATECI